jgi:hypothetical protein
VKAVLGQFRYRHIVAGARPGPDELSHERPEVLACVIHMLAAVQRCGELTVVVFMHDQRVSLEYRSQCVTRVARVVSECPDGLTPYGWRKQPRSAPAQSPA